MLFDYYNKNRKNILHLLCTPYNQPSCPNNCVIYKLPPRNLVFLFDILVNKKFAKQHQRVTVFLRVPRGTEMGNSYMESAEKQEGKPFHFRDSMTDDALEQQSRKTAGVTLCSSVCDNPSRHGCSLKCNKQSLLEQEADRPKWQAKE